MSSPDRTLSRRLFGLACAGLLALSTAGCFQPMYAQSTPGGGSQLRTELADIEVLFVGGRVGNEVRNDLIFALTGGAGNPSGVPYQLVMQVTESKQAAIVDSVSGLSEVGLVTVSAWWQLYEVAAPGKERKQLAGGSAFGKASLDAGYQRFARDRAIRDAQNRSATVVADQIRTQLSSYFVQKSAPKS
ncbi:hypothetical protein [Bosea sp. 117]|uniref:hypothetical protein n=1 Tax=Bosea sp. 117 TaxID=1125973 RepID=UPI00056E4975|nr:hypothetical protein [Bosea sp. 117]